MVAALADGGLPGSSAAGWRPRVRAHRRLRRAVASWFAAGYAPDEIARETGWPAVAGALWRRADVLRYGENPHQRAALYKDFSPNGLGWPAPAAAGIAAAELLHGKAMSYNNYVDADAARRAAYDFAEPCVAIIKHSNPCGIAIGADMAEAHAKANACDPVSAFGGVIAANGPVTAGMARQITDVFTEVVIAPGFEAAALDILSAAKNMRLLRCAPPGQSVPLEWRQVSGGILLQSPDRIDAPGDDPANWELKAGPAAAADSSPTSPSRGGHAVRSNRTPSCSRRAGLGRRGHGPGQPGGLGPAGGERAGDRAAGSVAASDAYFPFPDGFEILAEAGVAAVVEPGGSIRDQLTSRPPKRRA